MANNGPNIETTFTVDMGDLITGLNKVNQAVNHNKKVFDAATAGMDDWKNNSEGLNAKLTQLKGNLSLYEQGLKGIEDEIARVSSLEGDHTATLESLNKKYLDTKKKLGNTEKQIRKYSQALEEVEADTEEAQESTKKLDKAMGDLKEASDKTSHGFTVMKGVISQLVTRALAAFVAKMGEAITASREYRKEMGMLEATAEANGASFDKAKANVQEVAAITGDAGAAVEGLNNLMSAGFDGSALDDITDLLAGAAIKWKDTLKFEGLADGLQETLATGEAIGPFAEMLERSGISLDTFNTGLANCTTEAEKQNYILKLLQDEGLAEIKASYEENNKELIASNEAAAKYQDTMAEFAEKIEPALTAVRNGFTMILEKIIELVGDGNLDTLIEKITQGFQWFADNVIPLIIDFFKWLIDNIPLLTGLVTALVAKLVLMNVVKIVSGVTKAIKAWTVATKGQTVAQKLLNLAVKGNPLVAIVSLIATIIGALVTWAMTNEDVAKWFKDVWNGIVKFFGDTVGKFVEFGKNIVNGLWDGIKSIWNKFEKWFKDLWEGLVEGFKDFFGIESPSKLMAEMGGYLGEGVGVGIKKSMPKVKKDLMGFNKFLTSNMGNIKGGLLELSAAGATPTKSAASGINQIINAGMTVNYNGNLSRKQLKQLENDQYNTLKRKLKAEGAI